MYIGGGSRIPEKGVHMFMGVGVHFADYNSFLCREIMSALLSAL